MLVENKSEKGIAMTIVNIFWQFFNSYSRLSLFFGSALSLENKLGQIKKCIDLTHLHTHG